MKPISPDIHRLIESGAVEFLFCQDARSRNKSSDKREWFQGRAALDEAAGVKFSDQLYRRLIEECQTLIECLPIENNPREEWRDFHKKCLDLIAAAKKLQIKHALIEQLTAEAEEANRIAGEIPPFEKTAKRGAPRKITPPVGDFIKNVVIIYRQAGGKGHGSHPTRSSAGKTVHRGAVQELVCVIFDALRDYGCPLVFDGDSCLYEDINGGDDSDLDDAIIIGHVEDPKHTIARATIHQFLMSLGKN